MLFTKRTTVAMSLLALATIGFATTAPTISVHADTQVVAPDTTSEQAITEKAKQVILGRDSDNTLIPTGQERIDYLTAQHYDAKVVQSKVNELLAVEAPVVQVVTPEATEAPAPEAVPAPAPVQSTDTSSVDAVANQMAARTGVSADQWKGVIFRESGNNPQAVNASSGAYGYFQLLGHGEYPGMPVQDQIDMAVQVYQSQGAGAWVAW